ncbi:MAG: hypothetical protein ACK4OE_08850 [Acidovorax sp.]|uniref:hypothetical protein n=1 Tax=Acidovorax sp. TaxID=1872122 RepID=UPI00391903C3
MVKAKHILWALLCVALPACSPPDNRRAETTAVASRLIGHEYAVVPFSDTVAEGLACKFAATDDVWQAGVEMSGWTRGLLLCGESVPYLFLAKNIGVTQFAVSGGNPPQPYPRNRILAVQKLPKVSNYGADGDGSGLLELVDSFAGQCDLDGGGGSSFVALVRWKGEATVQGPPGVEAAWGFDVEAARIVPLNPQQVACEPMLMD